MIRLVVLLLIASCTTLRKSDWPKSNEMTGSEYYRIAGIQKDIVQTERLKQYPNNDRVAIYGWHRLNGKPIQPLYLGHVWWYVDYSQGVRLIHKQVKVESKR